MFGHSTSGGRYLARGSARRGVQDLGGFGETEHGGWALPCFDAQAREAATEPMLASDIFLLGRRTYQILERAWSNNRGPYAKALHKISSPTVTQGWTMSMPPRMRSRRAICGLGDPRRLRGPVIGARLALPDRDQRVPCTVSTHRVRRPVPPDIGTPSVDPVPPRWLPGRMCNGCNRFRTQCLTRGPRRRRGLILSDILAGRRPKWSR